MFKSKTASWILILIGLISIPLGLVPSQVMNYLTGLLQAGAAVELSRVWPVVTLFFLAIVGQSVIDIFKTFLNGVLLEQQVQTKILRIFDRLLRTSPDFYRKNEPAKVSKRVIGETRRVEAFWLNLKLGLPLTLFGLLGFGYVLFCGIDQTTPLIGSYLPVNYGQKGNWFLASLIIMLAPLQSVFLLFDKKIQTINRRAMVVDDDVANVSLETLDSISEIRSHYAFDYALGRVKDKLDKLRRLEIDITKIQSIFSGLGPTLDGLARVFLLGMGARLCVGDLQIPLTGIIVPAIDWKDFMGFTGMAMVVNGYVKSLGNSLFQWRMIKETIRRVDEFDNLPLEFLADDTALSVVGARDEINFTDLSFETGDGTRILNGLNFKIRPGEHVAFVGPSGCGKSTTMNLLIRELRQTDGELRFMDKGIADCNFVSLAEEVGQVRQKPILLDESLRDNMLLGLQRVTSKDGVERLLLHGVESEKNQIEQYLIDVVGKVGLKQDVIKKGLDNPLPASLTDSPLVKKLSDLRQRIVEIITQTNSQLVESFDSEQLLQSGTLLENILFGIPDEKLTQPGSDSPVSEIVQTLYKIVGNEPVVEKLLWLGQQKFLSDRNVAMQVRYQSPKLFEVLSAYRMAGDQVENLADELGSSKSSAIEMLKKGKTVHRQILVAVALATPACEAIALLGDNTFAADILSLRRKLLTDVLSGMQGIHSFALKTAVGCISLRECLLGGRVNREIHGASNTADAEIVETLEEAGLVDALILAGLEAPAGPRGQCLSGGQAMKVSIARILLKNPNVLLLDEATAALDEKSQAQIVSLIEKEFKDKTVIAISHRLSTIRDYDRILVFDRGQIVQEGTYDELVASEGLFREMVQQEGGDGPEIPVSGSLKIETLTLEHGEEKSFQSGDIQRAIALSPVFANMHSDQIMLLERMSTRVKCAKDSILFRRGDEGEELFIVLDGEIEFFVEKQDDSAKVDIVDTCGAGGTFGELALFGNVPRTLGARARVDSQLCVLSRDDIEKLVEIHPGIALSLLETVSRRIADMRDSMYAAES